MATQAKHPKMTFYQSPDYRSFRVFWLIHELNAADDFEILKLDSIAIKNTPKHLTYKKDVHPHGTIPALVIEGQETVLESGAICLYLADLYGKLAPPPDKRSIYYNWSIYASVTLDEILEFLYWQWGVTPDKPDPEGVARTVARSDIAMAHLSDVLKNRTFICGEEFTAADCILGYSLDSFSKDNFNQGQLLKEFPVVRKYLELLQARPAFRSATTAQYHTKEY